MKKFIKHLKLFRSFVVFLMISIFFFILLIGCEKAECKSDSDCKTSGCSGEICQSIEFEDRASICVFNPEFDCLKHVECGCFDNKCQWSENSKYDECIDKIHDINENKKLNSNQDIKNSNQDIKNSNQDIKNSDQDIANQDLDENELGRV